MNIVVIDGQGGSLGKSIVEQLKGRAVSHEVIAIGTNGIATANMVRAGADHGATGENPVVVACAKADVVIGPIGIIVADSLMGEVTATMATAVGRCSARKILIPVSKCSVKVVGTQELPYAQYVNEVMQIISELERG